VNESSAVATGAKEEVKVAAPISLPSVAAMRNKPKDAASKEERKAAREARQKEYAAKEEPLLYHE